MDSSSQRQRRREVHFGIVDDDDDGDDASSSSSPVFASVFTASHFYWADEAEHLWWTRDDFGRIRREATKLTRDIIDGDDSWAGAARKNSYSKCLGKLYKASLKGTPEVSKSIKADLDFWMEVGDDRRGLEKFCVDAMMDDRDDRKDKAVQAVLDAQHRCHERDLWGEEKSRVLRSVSESKSMEAKRFAELMAEADAHAVGVMKIAKSETTTTTTTTTTTAMVSDRPTLLRQLSLSPMRSRRNLANVEDTALHDSLALVRNGSAQHIGSLANKNNKPRRSSEDGATTTNNNARPGLLRQLSLSPIRRPRHALSDSNLIPDQMTADTPILLKSNRRSSEDGATTSNNRPTLLRQLSLSPVRRRQGDNMSSSAPNLMANMDPSETCSRPALLKQFSCRRRKLECNDDTEEAEEFLLEHRKASDEVNASDEDDDDDDDDDDDSAENAKSKRRRRRRRSNEDGSRPGLFRQISLSPIRRRPGSEKSLGDGHESLEDYTLHRIKTRKDKSSKRRSSEDGGSGSFRFKLKKDKSPRRSSEDGGTGSSRSKFKRDKSQRRSSEDGGTGSSSSRLKIKKDKSPRRSSEDGSGRSNRKAHRRSSEDGGTTKVSRRSSGSTRRIKLGTKAPRRASHDGASIQIRSISPMATRASEDGATFRAPRRYSGSGRQIRLGTSQKATRRHSDDGLFIQSGLPNAKAARRSSGSTRQIRLGTSSKAPRRPSNDGTHTGRLGRSTSPRAPRTRRPSNDGMFRLGRSISPKNRRPSNDGASRSLRQITLSPPRRRRAGPDVNLTTTGQDAYSEAGTENSEFSDKPSPGLTSSSSKPSLLQQIRRLSPGRRRDQGDTGGGAGRKRSPLRSLRNWSPSRTQRNP